MDIFQEIRSRVSMEETARRYGFDPDRQGKIKCPFHDDSHPSLQLYKNGRGWWCYVCDFGGSVIDFVARLYNLSNLDAALKINQDFSLGLSNSKPSPLYMRHTNHKRLMEQRKREKEQEEYMEKQKEFIELRQELEFLPKGGRAGEIMGRLAQLEYWFQENPWRW